MLIVAIATILIAALSRLAFYPVNFSPVIAMALFGGAAINDKRFAVMMPLLAMFISDILFQVTNIAPGFWGWGQFIGYGILALITLMGTTMKRPNILKVTGYSVASSLLFFFLSNSSVWLLDTGYYANNFSGLMDCLAAGVPFLQRGLVIDLFYSGVFFGGFALLENYVSGNALKSKS